MSNSNSDRIYLYDNAKAFLILLVVLGHICEPFVDKVPIYKSIFIFIYTFHMPLFIFISGLLSKPYTTDEHFRLGKFCSLIYCGIALKILVFIFKHFFDGSASFSLLSESGIPWYLFVLAEYELLSYLLRKTKPSLVIIMSIIICCFAGYDNTIGDYLCLSRLIVYSPFYFLGHYLTPVKYKETAHKKWTALIGLISIIILAYICLFHLEEVYKYRKLFTGRNSFSSLKGILDNCQYYTRFFVMLSSAYLGFCFLSIIPKKQLPFISKIGSASLQIYFWHMPILLFIRDINMFEKLTNSFGNSGKLIYLLLSIGITLLCSIPVFKHPASEIMSSQTTTH